MAVEVMVDNTPNIDIMPGEVSPMSERRTIEQQLKLKRTRVKVWPTVCNEIGAELQELDMILMKLGLPPNNFHKDRSYPYNDYETPPNLKTCLAKDFADYHVLPYLLPAVQSLIIFARKNRVFQCRYCTFNALDYIVEYMYNNNPRFPERILNPVPLNDIPFVKAWLKDYPRKPFPKWLTMTDEAAASIIQRVVRGFLVRKRPDVQEMRQFWRDYQKDLEDEKNRREKVEEEPLPIYSPYHEEVEMGGEDESCTEEHRVLTHSDTCFVCNRFKDFLHRQELYRLTHGQLSDSSIGSNNDSIEESQLSHSRTQSPPLDSVKSKSDPVEGQSAVHMG